LETACALVAFDLLRVWESVRKGGVREEGRSSLDNRDEPARVQLGDQKVGKKEIKKLDRGAIRKVHYLRFGKK